MIADRDNNLYMSALTLNGIMRRDARSGNVTVYTSSSDISFVDSLAWGVMVISILHLINYIFGLMVI